MPPIRRRLVIMCLLAGLPWAVPASAACAQRGKTPAKVTVLAEAAPVTQRQVSTAALLERWQPANGSRFEGRVLGATQNALHARSELALRPIGGSADCVELAEARITVTLRQEVRIDSRYPPGRCEHRRIHAHEARHVAVNHDAFARAGRHLRARMQQALAPLGALRDRPDAIRTQVSEVMQVVVAGFGDELARLTAARHQALDTPESYRRWLAGCGGW